jgi:serine/threonine-protein kinase
MADTVARPTQAGRVLGTPGYMAPEQARGEIVDHRADLFSLGVVLYEAVAGVPPFRGETGFDVLVATIRDAPAPLSELRRDLPAALDAIVQRCLAKAPDDRFPSAQALTDALDGLTANPATTPVTPPRAPLRWRRGSALAVALGVGLVAFGAVAKWRHPGAWPMPAPPAPPSASPPAPTALTDLPPPPTRSPEVAAEFGAGMQALRDNGWTSAGRHFTRALELDPTLALAHLRVAMISFWRDPVQMREHFAKALALRSQLTARDRVLLEALEPVLQRVHADPREALARLERASQRYPLDVEFFDWLAILRYGDPERALASSERAIELDAKDGQAWQNEGIALMLLARTEEARAAYERCATIAGDSVDCLGGVVLLDAVEGHCDTYEADTRRFYDRDPWVYPGLATTMVARGRPEAAVLEVLEQGAALEHDADPARRAIDETGSRGALAMFAGDVARAGELARRNLLAVSSNPTTRTDFALRLDSVILLVQALVESGREDEARAVARDFFAQGTETWITTPGDGIEPSLSLLRLTVGHGGPSSQEFATRRDTWIAERLQTSLAYPGLVWTYAYAATATTPDEARMALEVLPRFVPLTSFDWQRTAYPDAYIGHTYLLAGRPEEAIPYLSRAVGNCQILFFAFARMRAALDLGQAREAAGDRPGACAAYAVVIDRWGNARPHSVTAEKAKDRFKAITCPLR